MQLAAGATAAGSVVAANWLRPANANGVIVGYRVNVTYTFNGRQRDRYGLFIIPGNIHHITFNHAPQGTYMFAVEAENGAGFGPVTRAQTYASGDGTYLLKFYIYFSIENVTEPKIIALIY